MGEFNANRHKQSWNQSNAENNQTTSTSNKTDKKSANRTKCVLRKQNCDSDMKEQHFWSKVFSNNNGSSNSSNSSSTSSTNNGRKSQENYPLSRSPAPPSGTPSNDTATSNKSNHSTTATLLNSIISNMKDPRPKSTESTTTVNMRELDDIALNNITNMNGINNNQYLQMADPARKSTYNLIASIKPRCTSSKRRTNGTTLQQPQESEQIRNSGIHNSNGQRASLNSDINLELSDSNDTFLRTLNDLRLDYTDLSTNRSVEHRNGQQSSKERWVEVDHSVCISNLFEIFYICKSVFSLRFFLSPMTE